MRIREGVDLKLSDIDLSVDEELAIIRKWARVNPKVLLRAAEHPRFNCPFPGECHRFPCQTLTCGADCCENGHAFRRS